MIKIDGSSKIVIYSKQPIAIGEEITYDYNFSLFNTDQGQECKCGARECRGVIGGKGKDFLITVNDEEGATANRRTGHQAKEAGTARSAIADWGRRIAEPGCTR